MGSSVTQHPLRRGFQFGILDLLILTTVAGVAVSISQPLQGKGSKAGPWVCGAWTRADRLSGLLLFPDGYYSILGPYDSTDGIGWTMAPANRESGAFVLECGKERFVIRSEWGTETMEVLNDDGSVHERWVQLYCLKGPIQEGVPHGTWTAARLASQQLQFSLKYQEGVLIEFREWDDTRHLTPVNSIRKLHGLQLLSERNSPSEEKPERKTHE
jgi:hypothetical protein